MVSSGTMVHSWLLMHCCDCHWRLILPTQCFLLHACVTLLSFCSVVGPIRSSSGRICVQQCPAAGGPLHGLAHRQSVGGCCVGGLEHRCLHLWLHPHQRHGAAHPRPGKRHHHPPVCHRAALRRHIGTFQLHPLQEALTDTDWGRHGRTQRTRLTISHQHLCAEVNINKQWGGGFFSWLISHSWQKMEGTSPPQSFKAIKFYLRFVKTFASTP